MKSHKLPKAITNSEAEYFITEYVRYPQHQKMLRDWWFSPMTLQQISEKYNYCISYTKELLYKYTDSVEKMHYEKIQNE